MKRAHGWEAEKHERLESSQGLLMPLSPLVLAPVVTMNITSAPPTLQQHRRNPQPYLLSLLFFLAFVPCLAECG